MVYSLTSVNTLIEIEAIWYRKQIYNSNWRLAIFFFFVKLFENETIVIGIVMGGRKKKRKKKRLVVAREKIRTVVL